MPHRAPTALDRDACLALLTTQSLGRLVFTHRALPDVLPVTYLLDGQRVLIRVAIGFEAATAAKGSVVAFEADDFDALTATGWSVTIVGRAQEITHPDERLKALIRDLSSWGGLGRDLLLSVAVEKITGHRLTVAPRPARVQTPENV